MRCIFVAACCVMCVVLPVLAEDSGKEKKPAPTLQDLGLTLTSVNDMGHSAESLPARAGRGLPAWKNVIQDAFVVNKVETGSKADEAELEANDVISTINNKRFPSLDEANVFLGRTKPDKLMLSVYKNNGKYKSVNITLRETPGKEGKGDNSGNNTAGRLRGDVVDIENFLTERGFEVEKDKRTGNLGYNIDYNDALAELVKYGTAELRDKLRGADKFDEPAIQKQIKAELEEMKIKNKKFALSVVCEDFRADKVGDKMSSCYCAVYLPFHYVVGGAFGLIGKEQIDSLKFSYHRGKSNSTSSVIYISVSGSTDEIKELVRSKKEFEFRIVFTNLALPANADILDVKMDMKKR